MRISKYGYYSFWVNSQGFGLVCVFSDAVPRSGGADTGCGTHSSFTPAEAARPSPVPRGRAETQHAACRLRA